MKLFYTPKLFRIFPKKLLWSFSSSKSGHVYLTFDDGPNPVITSYFLQRLKELNWTATFFCVGDNAKKHPEILQQIIEEGHAIGNHTFNHFNAIKVKRKKYLENVNKANSILDANLFRPPYGKITPSLIREISEKYQIVMWSFMAYDFDVQVPMNTLELEAKKHIGDGDIIILHDNEKFVHREKESFEIIVKVLKSKGLSSEKIVL